MNTLTDKLAAAMRAMRNYYADGIDESDVQETRLHDEANNALAEYNARRAGPKEVPMCAYCGSTEVSADALVYWDINTQTWEVSDICDKGHYCNACEGETRLSWRQATPEEIES